MEGYEFGQIFAFLVKSQCPWLVDGAVKLTSSTGAAGGKQLLPCEIFVNGSGQAFWIGWILRRHFLLPKVSLPVPQSQSTCSIDLNNVLIVTIYLNDNPCLIPFAWETTGLVLNVTMITFL